MVINTSRLPPEEKSTSSPPETHPTDPVVTWPDLCVVGLFFLLIALLALPALLEWGPPHIANMIYFLVNGK